ncbi:hypothetical protein KVR01_005946 [Diaporthe batatas]|uniref:uncharacterized protein n=1 Tax=Diaporthe batatas TaxID=748121 RepID=UPI001D0377F6|nr:uncharacterized protein KVR01_005946 [Diaporthe batatas]KAG8164028.1 hypothetical protein KVR01_005946 [Diaporthe batatas]
MDLNLGQREVISAMRAAHPEMGLKRLTTEVNKVLPSKMEVEKSKLRDFLRSRDEPANAPVADTKPRDDDFITHMACPIFHHLREAEREYLLNLDNASIIATSPPHSDSGGRCHPVAHLRHHLVVLLVLLGFRPCALFLSTKVEGIATMSEMVLRCLVPLMEKFDLESYGFKLLYVATNPRTHNQRFRGFRGTWVLADTRHPGWIVVREMFVAPPRAPIPPRMMCIALGYPTHDRPEDGDDEFYNKVEILDATEHALLKDSFSQGVCRVCVLKIFCGQGSETDWERIVRYFGACGELAEKHVGTKLSLDLSEHERMRVWCYMTGRLEQSQTVIGE